MSPENQCLEDGFPIETVATLGTCSNLGGCKARNADVCPSKNAFCREACEVNIVCGWNVPGCAFDGYTAYGDSAGNGRFRR